MAVTRRGGPEEHEIESANKQTTSIGTRKTTEAFLDLRHDELKFPNNACALVAKLSWKHSTKSNGSSIKCTKYTKSFELETINNHVRLETEQTTKNHN